jgi:hypothetical protein
MSLAEIWLPLVGAGLCAAIAISAWYGGKPRQCVWFGFAAFICLGLLVTLQLDEHFAGQPEEDPNRPFVAVTSLGFPNILVQAGPVVIAWSITNTGRNIASIIDANMTVFVETEKHRLPADPIYEKNRSNITGTTLNPNETFQSHLQAFRTLTDAEVKAINDGSVRFFVYGYVKYAPNYERAFIARYNPKNPASLGMFNRIEGEYPKYGRNN